MPRLPAATALHAGVPLLKPVLPVAASLPSLFDVSAGASSVGVVGSIPVDVLSKVDDGCSVVVDVLFAVVSDVDDGASDAVVAVVAFVELGAGGVAVVSTVDVSSLPSSTSLQAPSL